MNEASYGMQDKYLRENERMMEAKDYLEKKGKLQDDGALHDKIWNRRKLLYDYRYERHDKLRDLLWDSKDEEIERVKEKASDMERKYEQ